MSSEIVDDIRVATIEISNESGINLSNYNSRLKHTGEGSFTLTSTSSQDNAISIDLPNGGLDVNVAKTVDFKALDETQEAITLQALEGGIGISALQKINIRSMDESTDDAINLETPNGGIKLTATDNISVISNSSINIESGLSDCNAINISAPTGGMNTFAQNIFVSCGQQPFFPLNRERTGISERLNNLLTRYEPVIKKNNIDQTINELSVRASELEPRALLCPIGYYSQASDYLMSISVERSITGIDNDTPGIIIGALQAATAIVAVGASGTPDDESYINSDLILFSEGAVIINSDGPSGIRIGTEYTVPIVMGTTENLTTINGDLTVSGNFKVDGYSVQNNVTVFTSEDPVFYLNTDCTGVNDKNIGFIGERGTSENVGWIWCESAGEWVAIGTDSNGVDNINTDVNDYKPARFGGLNVVSDDSRGPTATIFNVNVNGTINMETTLTTANAVSVISAGGIDIISTGTSKDIDIMASGSINLTATEAVSDSITLTTFGGIDVNTVSGIDITNTGNTVALSVNQQGTADIAHFKDNGSSALIVKDGGTVGINTSTPSASYKLDVNGDSNTANRVYQEGFMLVPPGAIMPYAVASAPGGWLLCDGSAVSRTTYATLFSLIGSTYGNGDGINTFNLPNMKGRMIVGLNSSDGSFDALGETGGSKTATLTTTELPAHTHTGTTDSSGTHNHGITDNGHKHTITTTNDDFNNSGTNPPGFSADSAGSRTWDIMSEATTGITINNGGAHTHTFTTASTGSGSAFSIMNPYFILNYIIKY